MKIAASLRFYDKGSEDLQDNNEIIAKSLPFSSKNPMPTVITMIVATVVDQEATEAILKPMAIATEKTEIRLFVGNTTEPTNRRIVLTTGKTRIATAVMLGTTLLLPTLPPQTPIQERVHEEKSKVQRVNDPPMEPQWFASTSTAKTMTNPHAAATLRAVNSWKSSPSQALKLNTSIPSPSSLS